MKATISLYSAVHITGDIADAERRCQAYLYDHTTIVPHGRFDVLDGGDNGGSYFVLVTTTTRNFGLHETAANAAIAAEAAFDEAVFLRNYQLARFRSGSYPTFESDSEDDAKNICLNEVLR